MTPILADANVLIALIVADHVHHVRVIDWFDRSELELATCPITQGALVRFLVREGRTTAEAAQVLTQIVAQPWHHFWPDAIPYDDGMLGGVLGHRQVTDAYLAALARHHDSSVATLDNGLAALDPDATLLIPA